MNLAQTFAHARPLAQHCPELTERGPRPEDRAEHLEAWRRDVAREVAQDMADLLSGTKLEATVTEPETVRGVQVFERIGPVAANSLLRCGAGDQMILLSFDVDTAIALTDRSFGGTGEPAAEPATSLPRSAGLLVEQAARIVAKALARVSAGNGASGAAEGDVIVRSESASRLKPFAPSASCVLLGLDLVASDGPSWSAKMAMPVERLDSLLPGLGSLTSEPTEGLEPDDPIRTVMSGIPLSLEAVLADFELSLGQLNQLSPGDQIPLSVPREIPLRVGPRLVARGSLGTLEDQMALELTYVSNAARVLQSPLSQGLFT